MLALVDEVETGTKWFSAMGCVVNDGEERAVYVGGTLLGKFEARDHLNRDVYMGLVLQSDVKVPDVAAAFEVSRKTAQRARVRFREEGFAGASRRRRGAPTKLTPALERKLRKAHAAGVGPRKGSDLVAGRLSSSAVQRLFAAWTEEAAATTPPVVSSASDEAMQLSLPVVPANDVGGLEAEDVAERQPEEIGDSRGAALIEGHQEVVQHAGSWVMLGMLQELGFCDLAERHRSRAVRKDQLRTCLDAAAIALTLGHGCIEGVRRIATESGPTLLRAGSVPAPETVRRTFKEYAKTSKVLLHLGLAQMLLEEAVRDDGRVVLYVDNHLRKYTGKHVLRKGWRMQDKRAVPGVSDYYVHDESGSPLWRIDVTSHDSLTDFLQPIARAAKTLVAGEPTVLLAFDRAGAFPEQMAQLRDAGVEFVTYERKPYPTLTAASFDSTLQLQLESQTKPVVLSYCETRCKNLKSGRGRIRRIAVKTEDNYQLNLLAISKLPAADLIRTLLLRWSRQENMFKHEVERWGLNQLDGREVRPYSQDAIIPNPARNRLEHQLRLAKAKEGEVRRKLARLDALKASRRAEREAELNAELERLMELQGDYEAQRADLPSHAPVRATELAGKLKEHPGNIKTVVDSLRIALANCEATLAIELAPHLRRPREAKKTLANLFAAPGRVRVGRNTMRIRLSPAGTKRELEAFAALCRHLNARCLMLPGDHKRRQLRFEVATS